MSSHEDKRQGPKDLQNALEVQRRRAAFQAWIFFLIAPGLILGSFFLFPQGGGVAEIQGTADHPLIKYFRGPTGLISLILLAWMFFKQAVRALDYSRHTEKEQRRELALQRRLPEDPAATRVVIELIEKGSEAELEDPTSTVPSRLPERRKREIPASQE